MGRSEGRNGTTMNVNRVVDRVGYGASEAEDEGMQN